VTDSEIAVTIARIDERLGTLVDRQAEIKDEQSAIKIHVQELHDSAIRFGNTLERTRQEMVMKAECVDHQNNIVALLPCPDGKCK